MALGISSPEVVNWTFLIEKLSCKSNPYSVHFIQTVFQCSLDIFVVLWRFFTARRLDVKYQITAHILQFSSSSSSLQNTFKCNFINILLFRIYSWYNKAPMRFCLFLLIWTNMALVLFEEPAVKGWGLPYWVWFI